MVNLHKRMMRKVLALAGKGRGAVSPNPMVGAIVTRRGLIVSRGYHKAFGQPHAEVRALEKINFEGEGCTLYVNLEPCCHFGKTPPCIHTIIRSGIREVVVGMIDPNPLVSGKGIQKLRNSGISVVTGVLEDECRRLNESYEKCITTRFPFVLMKVAMSLDGKIALASGRSKWITSEEARSHVHDLRSTVDAVLVGANTVREDNPTLDTRMARTFKKSPLRVVLDGDLVTGLNSKICNRRLGGKTIVFTTKKAASRKVSEFRKRGIDVIVTKGRSKYVNIKTTLAELRKRDISSVLVEGGREIFTDFLKKKMVDKLILVYGNKLVGGDKSISPIGEVGISGLNQAFTLKKLSVIKLAQDVVITGYI